MFNLALSYHRYGVEEGGKLYLSKAIKLYELAYTLLTSEEPAGYPIMLAAIFNNLGHANDCFGQCTRAQQCYQHLLMLLVYLVGSGQGVDMNNDIWKQFFRNVTSLVLTDRRIAPAA